MKKTLRFCALAISGAGLLVAQGGPDTESLLKAVQNPVASLISVPFQNNTNFPIGPNSRVQDVLNIQPVIPLDLGEDWTVITRRITPVVYQPNVRSPAGGANGLGDLNPSFFLSPSKPGKLIWGIGPTFLLPTAMDRTLGQGKWGAGPSLVLLVQPPHWTIGFLANNIWSFGGDRDRSLVNLVAGPILYQPESAERLVSHRVANHHRELDCGERQPGGLFHLAVASGKSSGR